MKNLLQLSFYLINKLLTVVRFCKIRTNHPSLVNKPTNILWRTTLLLKVSIYGHILIVNNVLSFKNKVVNNIIRSTHVFGKSQIANLMRNSLLGHYPPKSIFNRFEDRLWKVSPKMLLKIMIAILLVNPFMYIVKWPIIL